MPYEKSKTRERIINLLSDGDWKTVDELRTNRQVLSEMVNSKILEMKITKPATKLSFAQNRAYRLRQ